MNVNERHRDENRSGSNLGAPILKDRQAVRSYVDDEARGLSNERLIVLYVTSQLHFIAAEIVQLPVDCDYPVTWLVDRGHVLKAGAFILVERQLGLPVVDRHSLLRTNSLRSRSAEMDLPLLDHLIIAGDQMVAVGSI